MFLLAITSAVARADEVKPGEPLPGTAQLTAEGDLAAQMVDGIDRFLLRETELSVERRARHWQRDTSSVEAYEKSIAANRARLTKIIGVVDERVSAGEFRTESAIDRRLRDQFFGKTVFSTERFEVYAVHWPVVADNGDVLVEGEGLLAWPRTKLDEQRAARQDMVDVIAIPDADQTPEMILGMREGAPAESQFARHLAESGLRVLVPTLIDRADALSVVGDKRATNQPHREFIYRQAYEMGRHIIGYEVQKILAAIDIVHSDRHVNPKLGVIGYGEGGLIALYAAALDPRIDAVCVSGYFNSRQNLWQEPIYRNVFGLLDQFGDAELASLIAPRPLIIEACAMPKIDGPPKPHDGRSGAAPGKIVTPPRDAVVKEAKRAAALASPHPNGGAGPPVVVTSGDGSGPFGTREALERFVQSFAGETTVTPQDLKPPARQLTDPAARQKRQFRQLVEYTQHLMRESEFTRKEFWKKADASSIEAWQQSTKPYREYFYNEVIGRFDQPLLPPNVRSRQIYDEPTYTGYEVMLDVFPAVYAYGILLVPKDIKAGEKRPVVVCQHGLEGRPTDVADPKHENQYYHQFACRLAERGFITYAPQNPYIGEDRFRTLQRKANPLGKSLFSIIVPQHQQLVGWLAGLPMVDPARIGFYGLSYGGKTAMRVPAIVEQYALSICSADFNEWIWKNTSSRSNYSYIGTGEYEMFEFDLGNTFNYAEMAWLIAPRPFMVERGHHDGVAPDEWVAYEYARVRRQYAALKIPERTTIEFFDGPHTIHGVGTYAFLHEWLKWPRP
ncbi:MAG: dienelactone hydrolase family protein [Pirellulales bacterium]|nr:dienelactone hydrolase family protein [Pirellulales bacterium]